MAAVSQRFMGLHPRVTLALKRAASPQASWRGGPSPPQAPLPALSLGPAASALWCGRSLSGALCGAAGLHAARPGRRQLPSVPAAAGAAGEHSPPAPPATSPQDRAVGTGLLTNCQGSYSPVRPPSTGPPDQIRQSSKCACMFVHE